METFKHRTLLLQLLLDNDLEVKAAAGTTSFEYTGPADSKYAVKAEPVPFVHAEAPLKSIVDPEHLSLRAATQHVARKVEEALLKPLLTYPERHTSVGTLQEAKDLLYRNRFYGPYALVYGKAWKGKPSPFVEATLEHPQMPDNRAVLFQMALDVFSVCIPVELRTFIHDDRVEVGTVLAPLLRSPGLVEVILV
jgi:hypothetical protein